MNISRLMGTVLVLGTLHAQTPAPAPEPADPLGRATPQSAIVHFLEACHARDYRKAAKYLDLRTMPTAQRALQGTELAAELEDLLDDTPFDIATLSHDPLGDMADGLPDAFEHLDTFHIDGQTLVMKLERIELRPGLHVWLVSAPSVALIPEAHKLVGESPFEKDIPQRLVTFEVFDTPVWRWIALLIAGFVLWYVAWGVTWAITAIRPGFARLSFGAPLRICIATAGFRMAVELAPPASLARLVVGRLLAMVFCLALAWAAAVLVDFVSDRWRNRLDPHVQAVSYSVLPLVRQVLKLSVYLIAVLALLSAWGYNTSTIVAGLGVGGLAVALAAQKTLENLFGGISVIGDRPVLLGDTCRFGDRVGTVIHIGLRSTRMRTPERTIISVPNGQFSAMTLENISGRDKIWFHTMLNLRRDATADQLARVMASIREIFDGEPKVEQGKIPVRLVSLGESSLNVEIAVYILTSDVEEFLALQQELLLKILAAMEQAGTALAVPLQETFQRT
jgi:MscS family membrane protein